MGQAVSVVIAESVKSEIKENNFSQRGFVLERSYADWDLELKEIDGFELQDSEKLHVDVVAHTTEQTAELSSRTTLQVDVPVDIAIRRKFGPDATDQETGRIKVSEIDALELFVQEIYVFLVMIRTNNPIDAVWQSVDIVANPVRHHLRELRQFTAIVRLGFRADLELNDSPNS